MAAGRPRKPTAALKLAGNYRPSRHKSRDKEPVPTGTPVVPEWLDGDARAIWERVVPQLVELGIAKEIDGDALSELCSWFAIRRKLETAIETTDVMDDAHGKLISQLNVASVRFASVAGRFGLTPADRAKLEIEKPATTVPARKRG